MRSKPYFWSHNPIFGHHLVIWHPQPGKNCSCFAKQNLVLRFGFSARSKLTPICSAESVKEQILKILQYYHSVECIIARNHQLLLQQQNIDLGLFILDVAMGNHHPS
jgi:hypothetical protein